MFSQTTIMTDDELIYDEFREMILQLTT